MRKIENKILELVKKGYQPVYEGEEGYIVITLKAYLKALECADASEVYFIYNGLWYDLIDANERSEEIEDRDFDFMPDEALQSKFKVGDLIVPTPETDKCYCYTNTSMICAEVIEILGDHKILIKVKKHKVEDMAGKEFIVSDRYFEFMPNIKLISADDIFSDMEDIDLVYRAIDEKISNIGGKIYYLKYWQADSEKLKLNEKIEDLESDRKRYEGILERIVEYEKVRKTLEVKKDD